MRVSSLSKGALVAAALCLAGAALPASLLAGGPKVMDVSPTAFQAEASSLLGQIRQTAIGVKNDADQLQMLTRQGYEAGWEGDSSLLEDIRDQVNEMNKLLRDLRVHQAEASPAQQEIIERVTAPTLELAGATQGAIVTLNNNESHVYMTNLPTVANDIYDEASRVAQTVGNFDKYSHSLQEEQDLKKTLGI